MTQDKPLPAAQALGDLAPLRDWWLTTVGEDSEPVPTPQVLDLSTEANASEAIAAAANSVLAVLATTSKAVVVGAAAICGIVTNSDASSLTADVIDSDGQLDHAAWMRDCEQIRDAMVKLQPWRNDFDQLLSHADSSVATCTTTIRLLTQANTALLLDGPGPAAAALLAAELSPESMALVRPLQHGSVPAETLAWEHLQLTAVLAHQTRLNNGSLAPLAAATLKTALSSGQPERPRRV